MTLASVDEPAHSPAISTVTLLKDEAVVTASGDASADETPVQVAVERLLARGREYVAELQSFLRDSVKMPEGFPASWRRPRIVYLVSLGAIVLIIFLSLGIKMVLPHFGNLELFSLLGSVLIAVNFGAGPGILATLSSGLLFNFIVLTPHFHWSLDTPSNVFELILYLGVGVSISMVVGSLDREREHAAQGQAQLSAIFDAINDSVLVYDTHGHITRTNIVANKTLGFDRDHDFAQQPFAARSERVELQAPDGQPYPKDEWGLPAILRGKRIDADAAPDMVMRRLDGAPLRMSLSGAPIFGPQGAIVGAVAVLRDVAQRRAMEQERADQEQRAQKTLAALLHLAETLVFAPESSVQQMPWHLAELTKQILGCDRISITAIRGADERLEPIAVLGLSPEEEADWWAMQPDDAHLADGDNPALLAAFRAGEILVLDMSQPPYNTQPNPFGVTLALFAPMRIGDQLIGFISLDYNGARHRFTPAEIDLARGVASLGALVMERDRLLREREVALAEVLALQAANKQMDEFLGIASHELRTPITSIKATHQLVGRQLAKIVADMESATADQLMAKLNMLLARLQRIDGSMLRLERLITDLLDASRIRAGKLELKREATDIAELVRVAIVEVQESWPDRIVTLRLPDAPLQCMVDTLRFEQVIVNLLLNALKYAPADQPIHVSVEESDGNVRVAVQDAGPGLFPEQLRLLFERFSRVPGISQQQGSGVGLGLGLFICRTIIERHNGQIGVESTPGQGSTFWFTLPIGADW